MTVERGDSGEKLDEVPFDTFVEYLQQVTDELAAAVNYLNMIVAPPHATALKMDELELEKALKLVQKGADAWTTINKPTTKPATSSGSGIKRKAATPAATTPTKRVTTGPTTTTDKYNNVFCNRCGGGHQKDRVEDNCPYAPYNDANNSGLPWAESDVGKRYARFPWTMKNGENTSRIKFGHDLIVKDGKGVYQQNSFWKPRDL